MLDEASLDKLTGRTITDKTQVLNELDLVFRRGYASSAGERVPGIGALAVPVITQDGSIFAAIGNALPTKLVSAEDLDYQAEILKSGARVLAERVEGPRRPSRRSGR